MNTTGNSLDVNGTTQPDALVYTPTGAAAGTITNAGLNTMLNFSGVAGAVTLQGAGGTDTVTVKGTSAADTIAVSKVRARLSRSVVCKQSRSPHATTETEPSSMQRRRGRYQCLGHNCQRTVAAANQRLADLQCGAVADVLNITLATAGTTAAAPGATPDAGVITNPEARSTTRASSSST